MARRASNSSAAVVALVSMPWVCPIVVSAQTDLYRERDRGGSGVASSQFGTFVERGELVVYPFYEYYRDRNFEYKPSELGFTGQSDYFGRYRAHEGLVFLAYGISSRLLVEVEAAVITARLERDPTDTSGLPPSGLEQSGLGDVEAQLRYRWIEDAESAPEVFSYFESVFPFQRSKELIGTPTLELKYGMGVSRSSSAGTFTARAGLAYADDAFELGEYAAEYVRGLGDRLRVYLGVEGTQDEVELLTEAQIFLRPSARLKVNSAFGLTEKAVGWAPEIGIMLVF